MGEQKVSKKNILAFYYQLRRALLALLRWEQKVSKKNILAFYYLSAVG
jgi:hypothetical protein